MHIPLLTTITAYSRRPDMLEGWVKNILGCRHPEVHHILVVPVETYGSFLDAARTTMARELDSAYNAKHIDVLLPNFGLDRFSLGHCLNYGAEYARSLWLMKLDVDCLVHPKFFDSLIPLLNGAVEREWFNVGMIYANRNTTQDLLTTAKLPLTSDSYEMLTRNMRTMARYPYPQGSHFVCRREDYRRFGGCSPAFTGYGWEDYQQLYMLEAFHRSEDPLPGGMYLGNITQRCRDEIAIPKAHYLFSQCRNLAVVHRWHGPSSDPLYKQGVERNRKVLLDYILKARKALS